MNKKGKAKKIGFVGYFFFCIIFIIFGFMVLQNNTSTNADAIKMTNNIGLLFLLGGILGVIVGIVIGVILIIKMVKNYY